MQLPSSNAQRDARLVCGINQDAIQRKLLSEKKLTFDTALEKAQALEAAMKNAKEMQDAIAMTKQGTLERRQQPIKCTNCSTREAAKVESHVIVVTVLTTCRFIGKPYYKCSKLGHIGRVCRRMIAQQPELDL